MAEKPVELDLVVGGRKYNGWKSIRVTRSIESMSGSFALEVSDRWANQEVPWPIAEWDACRVQIDGETVIDGYIGKRGQSLSESARGLSYTGRDRAGQLVDCSARLPKWTYRNVTLEEFARTLAAPFDVTVSVQPGLVLKRQAKIVVNPGDSPFKMIQDNTSTDGVIVVSDGAGGIVITRSGTDRAFPLLQGKNVKAADIEYNGDERFHRYVVMTQIAGTDQVFGNGTRIHAEAIDEGVKLASRVLVIRPEKGYDRADAQRRADWEARIRAAKAETGNVTVQGWRQSSQPGGLAGSRRGELWRPNMITYVRIPSIGIDGDMLISQVDYAVDDAGGQVTMMRVIRPDAFTPEPKATVKTGDGGLWKEIAGGV
jgi:prophage tail gpP-like protein